MKKRKDIKDFPTMEILNLFLKAVDENLKSFIINRYITEKEKELVKKIADISNLISGVYLFRTNKELETHLLKMSKSSKDMMEDPLGKVWTKLKSMNEIEQSELVITAIREYIEIEKEILTQQKKQT